MRYTDFWLVETTTDINQNINNIKVDIDALRTMSDGLDENHPIVQTIAKNINTITTWFQARVDLLDKEIQGPGGVQAGDQIPLFNSVQLSEQYLDLDTAINTLNDRMEQFANKCGIVKDEICIKLGDFVSDAAGHLNRFKSIMTQEIEKEEGQLITRQGVRFDLEKHKQNIDTELIAKVSGKITGELAKIKEHYRAQVRNAYAAKIEPTDDEKRAARKAVPAMSTITKEITIILTGWLKQYRDSADSAAELEDTNNVLDKFLRTSEAGIIPLITLLNAGSGDILDHVPPEYQLLNQTDGFIPKLLELKPSGSGAGAWGPGELGLALLGTPVNKDETKGDLVVAGEKFELKASINPKSGGRINTNAVERGRHGLPAFNEAWSAFTNRAYNKSFKIKKDGNKIFFKDLAYKKDIGIRSGSVSYTTIGPTWIGIINEAMRDAKIGTNLPFTRTRELGDHLWKFVKATLKAPLNDEFEKKTRYNRSEIIKYKEYAGEKRNYTRPYIDNMGLLGEYTRQLLEFYQQTDGVSRILIINPIDSHFEVVSAEDPKGLMDKIKAGSVQVGSTYIGFKDSQSRATPQYGTARPADSGA